MVHYTFENEFAVEQNFIEFILYHIVHYMVPSGTLYRISLFFEQDFNFFGREPAVKGR